MEQSPYQVLGRLLGNVCRLHATQADRFMDQLGLYRGQAILLLTLAHHDGMTHSEIAEKLEISPAAATKVIKRLEQAGYLQRQADPRDERISRVFLREDAWAVIGQIRGAFDRLDRMMLDGLTESDREDLHRMLLNMQANLQQIRPGAEE